MDGFSPSLISSHMRLQDAVVLSGATNPEILVTANSNRVLLLIMSNGGPFNVLPSVKVSASVGININTPNTPLIIDFAKFPGIVGADWYVFFTGGTSAYVLEGIWIPQ
jgi:hypothetical protein